MTAKLTNNFWLNSRGVVFADSSSVSWALNKSTNTLTATALTAAAATSLAGGAAGSLVYQSATNVTAFLAAGSNGSLLTLTAGAPAWEPVPTWNQNTTGNAATATTAAACSGNAATATTAAACSGNSATATTAVNVSGVVAGANGGTGVANTGKTLTIDGNVTFSGAFTFAGTLTANTAVTFPTSGTLATTSQLPVGANPLASVGLAAVNGTASTFMTSDSAPALSQAITPVWSALHQFAGGSASSVAFPAVQIKNNRVITFFDSAAGNTNAGFIYVDGSNNMTIGSGNGTGLLTMAPTGGATFSKTFAINGGTPTAQLTGFGTPSGSPTSGLTSSSTLAQTAGTLAALLAYLKSIGFIGA